MTDRDFCLWLQGFFELTGATEITNAQAKMIKEHLELVFDKVTPGLAPTLDPFKVEWPDILSSPKPTWPGQITPDFDHLSRPTIIC